MGSGLGRKMDSRLFLRLRWALDLFIILSNTFLQCSGRPNGPLQKSEGKENLIFLFFSIGLKDFGGFKLGLALFMKNFRFVSDLLSIFRCSQ